MSVVDVDPGAMSFWVEWGLGERAAEPSAADVMSRLEAAESEATRLVRAQARDLQVLRSVRLVQQEAELGDDAPHVRLDTDGWVATEAGLALGLSESQVRSRLAFADALDRYSHVDAFAGSGGAPAFTLQKLCDHLDELATLVSPAELVEAEVTAVAWLSAQPRTLTALNRRMRRLVLRAKARAGRDDGGDRSHADRDVRVSSRGDGTADVWARLPEADALAVAAALRAGSALARAAGDPRTLAQLRADGLTAAVTGRPGLYGVTYDVPEHATGRPGVIARIDVTIAWASLSGHGHEPGEVAGYGPVPASTVVDLLGTLAQSRVADEPIVRGLLVDAASGRLVGLAGNLGRVSWVDSVRPGKGYAHSATMEALVHVRDRMCRAPGCHRPATACDADHIVGWPDGPTTLANTAMLCRYHHRLKTHAPGWAMAGSGDDDVVWTTPSGRRAATSPAITSLDPARGTRSVADPTDDPPPF